MRILAIDIGGTFTDLHLLDIEAGGVAYHKLSTTPDDPARGAMRGIRELLEREGFGIGSLDHVLHGTTIATNAVLKHEGARVGMVTTEHYRDIVHIGRHQRPQNYSIRQEIPWQARPLVKRRHRKTVPERVAPPDGAVEVPLDEDAVRRAAGELRGAGVEAVAVCFLFSYLNDTHERRAKEILEAELPGVFVTASSEVHPQFREFERFTTTAMNAFIGPEVTRYVERFDRELKELGVHTDLHIMTSNGGVATERMVKKKPVSLLYSGPAAGVLGGRWRASLYADGGTVDAITLDVGGTSADIGIVSRGELAEANVRETRIGGYPVMIPMIDIETIGAGGGSIAYLDPGGAFRVGPKSAGADPGPACYGRGGASPTVTDAHVVLGRIRPEFFLGGQMALRPELSRAAVEERLAAPLGMDLREASLGVLRIVNSNMANAIRAKTVQKGRDPARFTLVAFGGAGPMHAAYLARDLNVERVLVPVSPGVLSAIGLSTTDIQYDFVSTEFTTTAAADPDAVAARYRELVAAARAQLEADGFEADGMAFELTADCRYVGQGYELEIGVGGPAGGGRHDPAGDGSGGGSDGDPEGSADGGSGAGTGGGVPADGLDLEALRRRFDAAHRAEFGHAFPSNPVELVNERVTAYGAMPRAPAIPLPEADSPVEEHVLHVGEVCFAGEDGGPEILSAPFFDREALRAGHELDGPAIVVERDSTVVIPPGFRARVLEYGDLEMVRPQ